MLVIDEQALICDLAETYSIYDYRSLTPIQVATFSVGLREDSRIKLKMSGNKVSLETTLLAMINDRLAILLWSKTKDGEKNQNRPKLVTEMLLDKPQSTLRRIYSAEEYEEALNKFDEENGG